MVYYYFTDFTGAIDVKMHGSVFEKKSSSKMLGLTFSSKLEWSSYAIFIAKTASKKIGALNRSMKFLSPVVGMYLCKSTIWSCIEYCCHVWVAAPDCYLDMLHKIQKQICRTVGPSFTAFLEPLAHRQNIGSWSLFHSYYFGRCWSDLAQLFHFLILEVGLIIVLIDCMIFLSSFQDFIRMSMSIVFFLT